MVLEAAWQHGQQGPGERWYRQAARPSPSVIPL